jgi:hypothetical protein
MSQGIIETVGGAALIAAGVLVEIGTLGGGTPLAAALISAGAGMVMSGVGTMLSQGPLQGFATAARNPVAPYEIVYGRKRVGGTIVFINSFGDNDKYLDLVMVLAAHPSQSVDALLFDQQRIQMVTTGPGKTSIPPTQQNVVIADIARVGNVVTCKTVGDIPTLIDGDTVLIQQVPGDLTLNGKYPVANVIHGAGYVQFTYLCGGPASHVVSAGHVLTTWVDFGSKVYMETMLGAQTLGTTFSAMATGTPNDGNIFDLVQNPANPWTANCSLVGKTAVWLRLHYNDKIFANGLPQISFLMHGKNDIYDPRPSPPTYGYTENAALCIADHLSNQTWGFKAQYGTDIPLAPLIAAANVCDEAVALAWPVTSPVTTEKRYTCNGGFTLAMKRGDVLRNLLTSCAGRLTYYGGQYIIWPGAWYGVTGTITGSGLLSMATAAFRWRSTVSISNLYNGVKGTFISPANNWQSSDFPRYAQDTTHGYTWGLAPTHDANLDADGGDRRWLDIQLPFTISASMAQRIAKIELLRRRNQGTGTFALNMAGYQFTPMDVIAMDLAFFGWTGKNLEVLDTRLKFDAQESGSQSVVLLGVEIDVQETDPSIYAWSVGEELSPQGYQQAIVPDTRTPAAPTSVTLATANGEITISWDAPSDAYVLNGGHIEAQYQLVASPAGLWISMAKMDPTITQAVIRGLNGGDQYTIRIRSVNAAGVPSDWVTPAPIMVVAPLSLTFGGPFIAEVGVAFSGSLVAAGGFTPYTFSLASGSLPAGLSLNAATGAITGTPTTLATYDFTVEVTDATSAAVTLACSITVTTAATALAPNVSAATCSVTLQQWSNTTVPVFSGNFTLPGSVGTLAVVEVWIILASGKRVQIGRYDSGLTAGAVVAYTGYDPQILQAATPQNVSVAFICYNTDFTPTPTPFTLSPVAIPAAGITSLSAADLTSPGDRWQDPNGGALHAVLAVAIACGSYPQTLTLETTSPQYGRIWQKWYTITGPTTIDIGAKGSETSIFPPTAVSSEIVTVRAALGAIDAATALSGVTGVVSTTVSVSAPGVYASTGSSSASAVTVTYPMTTAGGASQYIAECDIQLPLNDPDFFFARITRVVGKYVAGVWTPAPGAINGPFEGVVGVPIGDWCRPTVFDQTQDHGTAFKLTTGSVNPSGLTQVHVTYGPQNVPSDGNDICRFYLYLGTRRDDGSGGTKTQQATFPSGANFADATIDGTKSDFTRMRLTTAQGAVNSDSTTEGIEFSRTVGGVTYSAKLYAGLLDMTRSTGEESFLNDVRLYLDAGKFDCNNGLIVKYDNLALAGKGVPHIVWRYRATNQTGALSISPTIGGAAPVGMFRVNVALTTTISSASPTPTGDLSLAVAATFNPGVGSGSWNTILSTSYNWGTFPSALQAVSFVTDGSTVSGIAGVQIVVNIVNAWARAGYNLYIELEKLGDLA